MTAEGLIAEPWFLESFLDLPDDLASTHKEGKRLVIMWELRGCPYCRETHLVNFAQPRIADYIKANFEVLQLNIIGDRKVKDFDGTELSEKALAAKYGIHFTPTFQFFPDAAAGSERPDARQARSRARARLSAARRLPRLLPLRARESIREGQLPRFPEIAAELSALP